MQSVGRLATDLSLGTYPLQKRSPLHPQTGVREVGKAREGKTGEALVKGRSR